MVIKTVYGVVAVKTSRPNFYMCIQSQGSAVCKDMEESFKILITPITGNILFITFGRGSNTGKQGALGSQRTSFMKG